jgi:hypothetical protein
MFEKFTETMLKQMDLLLQKHTDKFSCELFDIHEKLNKTTLENQKMHCEIQDLTKKNEALVMAHMKLENKLDKLEQAELINDISINGEFQIEPSKEKVASFVNKILPSVAFTDKNIIDFSVFKKEKMSYIKLKLDSNETKAKLFQAKKTMSMRNLFIAECLTPKKYTLLLEAKKIAKLGHLKFVWSRNGTIFGKKDETSKPAVIENVSDLKKFIC